MVGIRGALAKEWWAAHGLSLDDCCCNFQRDALWFGDLTSCPERKLAIAPLPFAVTQAAPSFGQALAAGTSQGQASAQQFAGTNRSAAGSQVAGLDRPKSQFGRRTSHQNLKIGLKIS